jgi:hypothetical protein
VIGNRPAAFQLKLVLVSLQKLTDVQNLYVQFIIDSKGAGTLCAGGNQCFNTAFLKCFGIVIFQPFKLLTVYLPELIMSTALESHNPGFHPGGI